MNIVNNRKFFYSLSSALILLSLIALFLWGLKPGIDFTGGSGLEVEFINERLPAEEIERAYGNAGIGTVTLQNIGERGALMRFRAISDDEHRILVRQLSRNADDPASVFVEKRFTTVGPAIGQELRWSSYKALSLVLLFILFYVAWAFRKVSKPVSSWKYGVVAIIALIHDVTLPIGFFAYLGQFWGVEIDMLFISGLLTILGFSVHDTIVVFDRIREKLLKERGALFEDIVERSVQETIVRSIITSLTAVIALSSVFFFGGETTRFMSLLLIFGMVIGVYTTVFIAGSLLVSLEKFGKRA